MASNSSKSLSDVNYLVVSFVNEVVCYYFNGIVKS